MVAYAVRIKKENKQVIASEHPKFDEAEFNKWLETHKDGYFLRDPDSALDCHYFVDYVFIQMYRFDPPGTGALFERVREA